MKNTTYLALLAAVSMTAPSHAKETPPSPTVERSNGTTDDEINLSPERPVSLTLIDRTDVSAQAKTAISIVKNTQAEIDRIKEALKRIRKMNPNLTGAQLDEIKERLMQRARDLVAHARSAAERIQDLKMRLGDQDELLDAAQGRRDVLQSAIQTATSRDRE